VKQLLFCLALAFFSQPLQSQTEIKISPIPLLFGAGALSVEQVLNPAWGLDLDVLFGSDFFAVNFSGKYYLDPRYGADRFHVGVFTGYQNEALGIGFLAGTKILSKNRVLFEIGLGIGRSFDDGVIGYGKLHLGYRFQKKENP
jgi:hypothetical protein